MIAKATKSSAVLAAAGIGSASSSTEKSKEQPRRQSSADSSSVVSDNIAEVIMVDEFIVILRVVNDVIIAVVARDDQNDLLLNEYSSAVVACLNLITLNTVTKKKLFDRLDQVFLVIDESVEDGGIIFELDAHNIYSRISMNEDGVSTPAGSVSGGGTGPQRTPPITASTAVREGIAAISRGDTDSLRSVFAGAAQTFSNFLGR